MNVQIIATRACSHRPNLERELKDLGVSFSTVFVEEHPEVVVRYGIRHSPNLVIDGRVVCRCVPAEHELAQLLMAAEPRA